MVLRSNILVTGGTGAFGQAFTRYALRAGARRVVIFSRSEAKQAAMREAFGNDARLRFFIGDVRDGERVRRALRTVELCVHAAALKRVEVCEQEPGEAIATNIVGTTNVARACVDEGVWRAVLLSTDKAAAPNTLYGATKLVAERAWTASNVYAAGRITRFAATRYGNVMGSTGSVLPTWQDQLARGEPLAVTDARCTRFWMSLEAAVRLVETAFGAMVGGEVFVPKIGAASLLTLLEALAQGRTFSTVQEGLRPGEKLHETLITPDEARQTYDAGDYYVIEPARRTWEGPLAVPPPYPAVPADFTYTSLTAPQLWVSDLRGMMA